MERTVTVRSELESIPVEKAPAMARELEAVTGAAPDGAVLAAGEMAAVRPGREPTRVALEAAPRRQAEPAEREGASAAPAPAAAAPRQGRGIQDDRDGRRAGRPAPPLADLPGLRGGGLPGG